MAKDDDKKTRLAQALRANLRKRKAQTRAVPGGSAAPDAPQPADEERSDGEPH